MVNKQFFEKLRAIIITKQNAITQPYRLFYPSKGPSGGPKSTQQGIKTITDFQHFIIKDN